MQIGGYKVMHITVYAVVLTNLELNVLAILAQVVEIRVGFVWLAGPYPRQMQILVVTVARGRDGETLGQG